jgi:hypothetical protein
LQLRAATASDLALFDFINNVAISINVTINNNAAIRTGIGGLWLFICTYY